MKRSKKVHFIIEILTVMFIIYGCGKMKADMPEETLTGEAVDEASHNGAVKGSMNAYRLLLTGTKDTEELYRFIAKNIEDYDARDADQLIISLIDFAGDTEPVDYNRLAEYMDDVTPEMDSFIRMMRIEQENPAVAEGKIRVDIDELLERVITAEDHLKKFPDGLTGSYTWASYTTLMTASLQGSSSAGTDTPNPYADGSGYISDSVIEELNAFTEEYECTESAAIVKEYLETLAFSANKVTPEIKLFYEKLPERIKDAFTL